MIYLSQILINCYKKCCGGRGEQGTMGALYNESEGEKNLSQSGQ